MINKDSIKSKSSRVLRDIREKGIMYIQLSTCANKISACTIAEIMKNSVSMVLDHFSMNVKARITELRNFLGQQLYSIHRVAKNNGLIYLQLKSKP